MKPVRSVEEEAQLLAEHYGLELLLIQNDIEPWVAVKLLLEEKMLDIEDYFFEDEENVDEERD